ncbi:MAG: class IV adenylate cyclase [Melioribacteraceae bacterium]
MPLNLELKIQVDSHAEIISKLKKIGAEDKGMLIQKDIYYKVKNGLLKLRVENKTYTLIKYLRDEKGKRWSNYELLRLDGKNPEKYISEIFDIAVVVEKKRRFYLYKNTRVHLDSVKNLGGFLELETLLVGNKNDAQKRFDEMVRLLDLDLRRQIRSSYKDLMMKR